MFEFKLPDLGEGIAEGQIVAIMVKEGDAVEEYQDIIEVETDKAAVPIPSPKAGVIAEINVEEGQIVKVGEVMLSIDTGEYEGVSESEVKAGPVAASTEAEAPRAFSIGGGSDGGAVAGACSLKTRSPDSPRKIKRRITGTCSRTSCTMQSWANSTGPTPMPSDCSTASRTPPRSSSSPTNTPTA